MFETKIMFCLNFSLMNTVVLWYHLCPWLKVRNMSIDEAVCTPDTAHVANWRYDPHLAWLARVKWTMQLNNGCCTLEKIVNFSPPLPTITDLYWLFSYAIYATSPCPILGLYINKHWLSWSINFPSFRWHSELKYLQWGIS